MVILKAISNRQRMVCKLLALAERFCSGRWGERDMADSQYLTVSRISRLHAIYRLLVNAGREGAVTAAGTAGHSISAVDGNLCRTLHPSRVSPNVFPSASVHCMSATPTCSACTASGVCDACNRSGVCVSILRRLKMWFLCFVSLSTHFPPPGLPVPRIHRQLPAPGSHGVPQEGYKGVQQAGEREVTCDFMRMNMGFVLQLQKAGLRERG